MSTPDRFGAWALANIHHRVLPQFCQREASGCICLLSIYVYFSYLNSFILPENNVLNKDLNSSVYSRGKIQQNFSVSI